MKILVVDDEKLIRDVIRDYLENDGYEVIESINGQECINICKENDIDLIIMDIMMPKMDGFSALKEISKDKNIPCIVLSAKSEETDKLNGFELGIDDYVTKPFSPKELMARVKAILKRNKKSDNKLVCEGIVIDNLSHELTIDGKIVETTPKEYDMLKYLMENKNKAVTREELLKDIWGYNLCGDTRTIDTHIKVLRKILGKYENKIVTIREVGYKFDEKK